MSKLFKWRQRLIGALAISTGGLIYSSNHPSNITETEFVYQKNEFNDKVLNLCKNHLKQYQAPFFLKPHGGLQQLWHIYGAKDRYEIVKYERDILKMTDGGQIAIDWAYPNQEDIKVQDVTKVCFVFPGLSGSSDRHYIKSLVKHLTHDKGYIVGVFHNRGITLEYTSPEFADLSSSQEVERALNHMVEKFKDRKNVIYVGVGLSMGANMMLRVAGEQGDKYPLEAMVSFNNPFDIWLSINLMRNTRYEKFLARELRKNVVIREDMADKERNILQEMEKKFGFSFEELKKTESWKEFDEKLTLKIRPQFKTVPDYYYAASCLTKVKDITKPTLVVHSRDDPIIPFDCLPLSECLANKNFIVGIVNKGGHVCYFQGIDGQQRWYPLVSSEYLDAVIELKMAEKLK